MTNSRKKQNRRRQHRKKAGKPEYQKKTKNAETVALDQDTIAMIVSIKANTDDLAFKENVGSFKEAYANGKRDALTRAVAWTIDMRNYLNMIPMNEETDKEFCRYREVFNRRFLENFRFIESNPVGKPYDPETMEVVDNVPTDDPSLIGTVAEASDMGYYICDDVVVRRQCVSTYTMGGSK